MEPLKFGIIGCSRIAKRSVIPAIIKSEFAELEIIGSRSTDKAKQFASEFNCEKSGTYEDVISDDSVDVVYISTPIDTHAKWQSEDGGRFHLKSNYNMIVEVKEHEKLKIPDSFIWVTLYQIKQLMKIENFVGPHVRGIISYL